jgi:hypothetical protein
MITLDQVSRKMYSDSYKHLEPDEKANVKRRLKEAKKEVSDLFKASRRRP